MNKKVLIALSVLFLGLAGIIVIVIVFMRASQHSQPTESIPQSTPTATVSAVQPFIIGWTSYWDDERSLIGLNDAIEKIDAFSPILYHITSGGELELLPFKYTETALDLARINNLPITPVIGDDFDYKRVRSLLYNEQTQKKFIAQLISQAKIHNYDGWEIDIETLKKHDTAAFSKFTANVYKALHENDLTLRMILYAKDEKETYPPTLAQDYSEIAKNSDEIILMMYGFNNDSTRPGAQAPLEWYRSVLKYTLTQVPKEKVIVGLTTHGYDWSKVKTEGLTYPEIQSRITEFNAEVTYDSHTSSKIAHYSDNNLEHVIWFEDVDTIWDKIKIAQNEFGVNKFAIWRVGSEDVRLWDEIVD